MTDKTDVLMRPYILKDIPFVTAKAALHIPHLPNYKGIEVSEDRLAYLLRHNYGNSAYFQMWVLVDKEDIPIGAGAGYLTPGMVTWDKIASDVFLYVEEEYRCLKNVLRLMTAYKMWAKANGAKMIMASQTGGYRVEAMNAIMRRQGYVECGYQWMLRTDDNAPIIPEKVADPI